MIDFLEDPQLTVAAHHHLSGLLGDKIAPSMTADETELVKGGRLFGWSAHMTAEAKSDALARLRAWWEQNEEGITLPRIFNFSR
jgi:hypothetical protein